MNHSDLIYKPELSTGVSLVSLDFISPYPEQQNIYGIIIFGKNRYHE